MKNRAISSTRAKLPTTYQSAVPAADAKASCCGTPEARPLPRLEKNSSPIKATPRAPQREGLAQPRQILCHGARHDGLRRPHDRRPRGEDDPRIVWKSPKPGPNDPPLAAGTLAPLIDPETGILFAGRLMEKTTKKDGTVRYCKNEDCDYKMAVGDKDSVPENDAEAAAPAV